MQNESTVYEVGFHMNPSLPDGEVLGKVADLKQAISERGGTFISEGVPVPYELAYTIIKRIGNENKRFSQSVFDWVKFEMDPASIVDLKKMLEGDTDIIRFLIIKTVREDTMISTRPEFKMSAEEGEEEGATRQSSPRKVEREELTKEEEEQIDKEIDDLVSDEEETSKE